jgi:tRNA (guanine-N7-)-methyltransferase
MGKGRFIIDNAIKNPNINYIGIEKFSSVLVRAIERKEHNENELKNLYFLRFKAYSTYKTSPFKYSPSG